MNITGTLKFKKETQKINETFKKREFVITETQSKYPQVILFQVTQANCDLLDRFESGDDITVHFNLRGREWTSPAGEVKYFNTLEAWKLEKSGAQSYTGNDKGSQEPAGAYSGDSGIENASQADYSNDLPF